MPLLQPVSWDILALRLGLAVGVGGLIGWERESTHKPAGLRTHMLVSLGAALFVLISIQIGMLTTSADAVSRIMQGIITGIGFLGAGEIFAGSRANRRDVRIKGLTSAAAIWVSAGLGIAAGCGLWALSLISALLAVFILRVLRLVESQRKGDNPEE